MARDDRVVFGRPQRLADYPTVAADALFRHIAGCSDALRWYRIKGAVERAGHDYRAAAPAGAAIYEGFVQIAADEAVRANRAEYAHFVRVNAGLDSLEFATNIERMTGVKFDANGEVPEEIYGFTRVEFHSLQCTFKSVCGNVERILYLCGYPRLIAT